MAPLRLLVISHTAGLDGAERSLLTVLGNLDRARFEPLVVLPNEGELGSRLTTLGIEYEVQPMSWWLGRRQVVPPLRGTWQLAKGEAAAVAEHVAGWQPDLVYTNTLAVPHGGLIAERLGLPHVWHARETLTPDHALRPLLPSHAFFTVIALLSTRVIAISEATAAQFPRAFRDRVRIIYNGIEAPERETAPRPAGRAGPRLVHIGRLMPMKGQLDAVIALEMLRLRLPDAHLTLVGVDASDYGRDLKRYVREHRLDAHVSVLGYVDQARDLIPDFDLTLVSSWTEAFSRVAVESMLAGVPVIASSVGGLVEVLSEGGGVLVPPKDPAALADAIESLWHDPDRLKTLGVAAREAAARFSVERLMTSLQTEFMEAAASGGRSRKEIPG